MLPIFRGALLWAFCCTLTTAWAQARVNPAGDADLALPYQMATVSDDADVVRLFFSPTCGFSRQAHLPVTRWGATLPRGMRFEATPVVTREPASAIAAAAYFTVSKLAPERIDQYTDLLYSVLQDRREPADQLRTYAAVARQVGVDPARFEATVRSAEMRDRVFAAAKMLARYKLSVTPTLAVGGRFLVTSDATQGINSNFFELLNAVASKYLIERGAR